MNGSSERSYLLSTSNSSLNGPYSPACDRNIYSLNGDTMQEGKINHRIYNAIENGKNQGLKSEVEYDNMEMYMDGRREESPWNNSNGSFGEKRSCWSTFVQQCCLCCFSKEHKTTTNNYHGYYQDDELNEAKNRNNLSDENIKTLNRDTREKGFGKKRRTKVTDEKGKIIEDNSYIPCDGSDTVTNSSQDPHSFIRYPLKEEYDEDQKQDEDALSAPNDDFPFLDISNKSLPARTTVESEPHLTHKKQLRSKQNSYSASIIQDVHSQGLPWEFAAAYDLLDLIGIGTTSKVYECRKRHSDTSYACKIIDKRKLNLDANKDAILNQLRNEIKILASLDHPNILKFENIYETVDKIYIVTELVSGGELFDFLLDEAPLSEEVCCHIMRQVIDAVCYLHSENVIHRDIKAENLLLVDNHSQYPTVKLIDFGFSTLIANTFTGSFLGTVGYIAPEIRQNKVYSCGVDIWACGILLYLLLAARLPFDSDICIISSSDINKLQATFRLTFEEPIWKIVTNDCQDLIRKILEIDPMKRYTARQILQHRWIKYGPIKRNGCNDPAIANDRNHSENSNDQQPTFWNRFIQKKSAPLPLYPTPQSGKSSLNSFVATSSVQSERERGNLRRKVNSSIDLFKSSLSSSFQSSTYNCPPYMTDIQETEYPEGDSSLSGSYESEQKDIIDHYRKSLIYDSLCVEGSSRDGRSGDLQDGEDRENSISNGNGITPLGIYRGSSGGNRGLKRNISHQSLEQISLHKENNDKVHIRNNHDTRSRNKYVRHAHITLFLKNVGDLSSTSTSSSKFLSADSKMYI